MKSKISYLTIDKLKNFIRGKVYETMEDFLEDLKTLFGKDYINSIKEARINYRTGDFRGYSEVF